MKKLTECFDQWDNLPTYVLADDIDVNQYHSMIKNCNSYDDFQAKVYADITDKIDDCRKSAQDLECDSKIKLILLASIEDIDVTQIVNRILGCYESNLRIFKLESRVNRLYNLMLEKKGLNERSTTSPHEGDLFAFNIATKFDKDDVDVDSDVDVKNKKDAWTIRLVYNDSTQDDLSLVKLSDDKDDYSLKSNKDKLNVKFTDDDSDNKLAVPQEVIAHIQKHIDDAESKLDADRKKDDRDLGQVIAYEIKKNFPNYDLDVLDGDDGKGKWNIEIVYPNGQQDSFTILKVGTSYIMKSKDSFIAKYDLDELKEFPSKLKDHIQKHVKI